MYTLVIRTDPNTNSK
jgi:hypothetical protein